MIGENLLRRSVGGVKVLVLDEDILGNGYMVSGFLVHPMGDTRPDPD
jgi:hypothetical protein